MWQFNGMRPGVKEADFAGRKDWPDYYEFPGIIGIRSVRTTRLDVILVFN